VNDYRRSLYHLLHPQQVLHLQLPAEVVGGPTPTANAVVVGVGLKEAHFSFEFQCKSGGSNPLQKKNPK